MLLMGSLWIVSIARNCAKGEGARQKGCERVDSTKRLRRSGNAEKLGF